MFIGSTTLANPQFPIIFEHVQGICEEEDSSFVNKSELDCVFRHIDKLMKSKVNGRDLSTKEIGVVSPYRSQCDRIKTFCKKSKYDGITVGTAEIFQGQERPIMIVSTVRTNKILGFVKDEKVSHVHGYSQIIKFATFFSSKYLEKISSKNLAYLLNIRII